MTRQAHSTGRGATKRNDIVTLPAAEKEFEKGENMSATNRTKREKKATLIVV